MLRLLSFALSLSVVACAKDRSGAPPPVGSAAPGAVAPSVLGEAVRTSVCNAAPCGGPAAEIRVYRDPAGAVRKLYRLYGACVHSPGIYFEATGTVADTIPEQPIAPGSEQARALEAKHAAQVGGLKHTDTIRCRDGAVLPP